MRLPEPSRQVVVQVLSAHRKPNASSPLGPKIAGVNRSGAPRESTSRRGAHRYAYPGTLSLAGCVHARPGGRASAGPPRAARYIVKKSPMREVAFMLFTSVERSLRLQLLPRV